MELVDVTNLSTNAETAGSFPWVLLHHRRNCVVGSQLAGVIDFEGRDLLLRQLDNVRICLPAELVVANARVVVDNCTRLVINRMSLTFDEEYDADFLQALPPTDAPSPMWRPTPTLPPPPEQRAAVLPVLRESRARLRAIVTPPSQ